MARAGVPHPIDIHVGARVRLRRNILGMSLETLGKAVGVTYQQLQKYEKGVNRIGASRLFGLSNVLEVKIAFFFQGIEPGDKNYPGKAVTDLLAKRETTDLIRTYYQIEDPEVRKRVLELVRSLATEPRKTRRKAA